jgi:hypothetical protein
MYVLEMTLVTQTFLSVKKGGGAAKIMSEAGPTPASTVCIVSVTKDLSSIVTPQEGLI